jgi:hypothetical protein
MELRVNPFKKQYEMSPKPTPTALEIELKLFKLNMFQAAVSIMRDLMFCQWCYQA